MIQKIKQFFLLIVAAIAVNAVASISTDLNGTWVVDALATEAFVLRVPQNTNPDQIARAFIAAGPYYGAIKIVIEGEVATASTFGDMSNSGSKFRLVGQNQTSRQYTPADAKDMSKGGMNVTVLNADNIQISFQNDQLGSFVLWKRVVPSVQQKQGAFDSHAAAWLSAIQNIKERLFDQDIKQSAVVRPNRWSEEATLPDGRLITVEREVSYTFEHSVGDAGSGFAVFKNKISTFRLHFKHPETKEIISWEGLPRVSPILLDVVDGTPYLILLAEPTKDKESIYGCTELPFVYLAYDTKSSKKWRPIDVAQAPSILMNANLSLEDPSRSKDHLLAKDVRETNQRIGGSAQQYFQPVIPRAYREWRYVYKNSYRDERRRGDCRPPRVPPPPVTLPTAIPVDVEILNVTEYEPDRIFVKEDWGPYSFYLKGEKSCKSALVPADEQDRLLGRRFSSDETRLKRVPYSDQFGKGPSAIELCDDYVWFISRNERLESTLITKYTLSGDLVYRFIVNHPTAIYGYVGMLRTPSLRSEFGYFYFEYMYFIDRWNVQKQKEGINQKDWNVKRVLAMRFKEP